MTKISSGKRRETYEFLRNLYENAENPEDYVLSFSDIPKYGINPNNQSENFKTGTPVGFYGYSLKDFFEQYGGKIKNLPYARKKEYIVVVRLDSTANKFVIEKNRKDPRITIWLKKLPEIVPVLSDKTDFVTKKINDDTLGFFEFISKLFDNFYFENKPKNKSIFVTKVFRFFGIDVIYDKGTGIVHHNEPYQVAILNLKKGEVVKTLLNPEGEESTRKKKLKKEKAREIIETLLLKEQEWINDENSEMYETVYRKLNNIFDGLFGKNENFLKNFFEKLREVYEITKKELGFYNPTYAFLFTKPGKELIEKLKKELNMRDILFYVFFKDSRNDKGFLKVLPLLKIKNKKQFFEIQKTLAEHYAKKIFEKENIKYMIDFMNNNGEFFEKAYEIYDNSNLMVYFSLLNYLFRGKIPFFIRKPEDKKEKILLDLYKRVMDETGKGTNDLEKLFGHELFIFDKATREKLLKKIEDYVNGKFPADEIKISIWKIFNSRNFNMNPSDIDEILEKYGK